MATHTFTISVLAASSYYADKDVIGENKDTIYATVHNAAEADGYSGNYYGIVSQMATLLDAEDDTWDITIQRTFMYFSSSSIKADAPIYSAKLYIKVGYLPATNFVIQIQRGTDLDVNGIPIVHHVPFQYSDFNYAGIGGNGGSINTSEFIGTEIYYPITFNETGISWISKGNNAVTKFILRHQGDVNASSPDDANQYLWFYNSGVKRSYLSIEITLSIPTATTQAATNVDATIATFNGTITDNGWWIDNYGFEWKKGVGGDITSIQVGDSSNQNISTFLYDKTELESGTLYYYRAWGSNEAGKGYGEWIEFTTTSEISVTTEAAAVPVPVSNPAYCEFADGNGTITSAANATERGFEVKHIFSGTLYDVIMHEMAGFVGDTTLNFNVWEGTLIKIEHEHGDFVEGAFTLELGAFPAFFYDKLFAGESYTYRAYAIISGVTYYGEWVAFSLGIYTGEGAPSPTDDISEGDPTVPIIPIDIPIDQVEPYPPFEWEFPPEIPYPPWDWDLPDLPPWILPDLPEWEIPDYPPLSFIDDFYYRKPYTAKDLDELRKKCIIYNKNSVEFALVLRHNMNVLREFFNMMTDYMGKEEFNDFTDVIPPQRLKELYLDPLEPNDFKDMINGFIRNTVDDNIAVNRNFSLIQEGLSDYETGSDDAYFTEISSAMKTVTEDNPDVDTLKRYIDNLNQETASNYSTIMHNLEILRAKLL